MKLQLDKIRAGILIVILFHTVGLIGFFIPALQPLFLKLVPFHLLLMFLIMAATHQSNKIKFAVFALLITCLGFFAEWIGVHTHWLFGDYKYGETLGIKADDIPLMIGINWVLLIYASGTLMQQTKIKSRLFRVLFGAIVLVLLDLLIEPVAIRFDYWTWMNQSDATHEVPLKNYIDWYIFGFLLLTVFECFRFEKQSRLGPVLLATQFVFFIVLQWSNLY